MCNISGRSKTQNIKEMKNLFSRAQIVGATTALGLFVVAGTGLASSSPNKDNKTSSEEELIEEFSFVEIAEENILLDERPEKMMFFDQNNALVFETIGKTVEFKVEILLRKSDLLLEFEGTKFYRLNN